MKKIFAGTPHTKFIAAASALTWAIAMANSAGAAQLQEARVTQVVNDVKLLLEQSAPRPAAVSDLVRRGNAVRTGTQSRSELTFSDLTITRLGANTIFSFKEGTREMTLIDGAILFQVPKGSGGATIRTVGVTAAITGTTGIAEFHPATSSHPQLSKWLCLEGTFHLYLPNGQSVELGPGKMATADGKSFSKVSTFDIAKLTSTSLFFTGFDQPLASMNLIMLESQSQVAGSLLAGTTNPLDPTRIVNVTSQAIVAEETPSPSVSPTVTPPPPTPSKFGTPSVISSPAPYRITNGTVITTDPSITTNGVTDYGKIYRGQTDDGAFSLWAFGSTSVFDTAVRIDNTFFADPTHLPIAVFKFQSLSLTGDPTIDTSNGVPKLALIGVDGITSGSPGGTLKFTGLDLLLLATVNGSINLTSNVSFQDLHELVMYARGAGSDLTINSPISNIGILGLVAEDSLRLSNPGTISVGKLDAITGGDLVLQIGGSLLLDGRVRLDAIVLPGASVASGINLTLNVAGDYTNSSATQFSHLAITNRDHIGGDAGIALRATNISTANNLDVQIVNQGRGRIGENALINVEASNDINIVGDATFQILNNDGGHIDGNGNISVTTGGDITANSILAFVNNHNGGSIGAGANINFDIGGALTTQGDATFVISNLNEGPGGGTIGSLASVDINAASISVGGFFQTFVGANGGGSIQGDAINTVNVSGDLTAQQGILVDIQDTGFIQINPTVFIAGGHIGSDATVTLAAQNITTSSTATGVPGIDTMALEASIYSDGSGTIGGNAIVNVLASQNISAPGTVFFGVANDNYQGFGGGTIGGDAQVNVTAGSLSTGALFDDIYNNRGGSIGRDAIISLNVPNGFTATGNAEFAIFNPGGIVGRNASIGVTAGDISAPSLTAEIDNSSGGMIGGNASINVAAGGTVNAQGNASFVIDNNNSGLIGSDATINVTAGSISTGGALNANIYNTGGTIGGDAAINLAATNISVGTPLAPADLDVSIDNNGGTIGGSVATNFNVSGDLTVAGAINAFLNNGGASSSPGNHITGDATINVLGATGINAGNGAFFSIGNEDAGAGTFGGTIDGNALVRVTADHLSAEALAPSDFNLIGTIHNRGGSIVGNSDVMFDISGAITTAGRASFDILNFDDGGVNGGGMIGGAATVSVNASALSIDGELLVDIQNQNTGTINSNGNINLSVGENLTATDLNIFINNFNTGMIGGDAAINITANNISTGGSLFADIFNYSGGSIGGGAMIDVTAANITANSLVVEIDNTSGSIGASTEAGVAINMNVSGTATVTNDATFQILGSDGATSAGININGGNYNVGGTFLSYIDGNGTIIFSNASAHADVLKAGVFGANGVLNIGGGMLSADTTLKLYAPGSNGQLNFISNVTLGGNSLKILAANSITIFNNVVVTIGGPKPADVYTGFTGEIPNANYTGFGGNRSTTGTFAGAGANDPQPLTNAPPFGPASSVKVKTGGNVTSGKKADNVINVRSSDELLALLDHAAPGPGGKITIPASKNMNKLRDSSRIAAANRLNAGNRLNVNRRAMDMRSASSSVMRHSPQ